MTKEQQKIVDGFHERVIALIFKRRRAQKYSSWTEEESINQEIFKVEDERRKYERDCKSERQEKRKIPGGVPEIEAGAESSPAETEV